MGAPVSTRRIVLAGTAITMATGAAINTAGRQAFAIIKRVREELKVNTTCGASNISFGLPNRDGINSAFLTMSIGAGLTSAITSPSRRLVSHDTPGPMTSDNP